MKLIIAFIFGLISCVNPKFDVKPGIASISKYKHLIEGKNIGVVSNRTSIVEGMHSVDYLIAKGFNVVKVFAPEHGFRGDADAGSYVKDYTDTKTGLPVISLYGNKKKPTSNDLDGIDVIIFDIQDVGVRFYTYISTMHYVMEACAENHIRFIVADRPNPNAFYIDGPVLRNKFKSFIGMHNVPIVYGMSIGEYALMINGEKWLKNGIKCDLDIMPCVDWDRNVPISLPLRPSPNLPDSISVMLYPSVGFFEGTVISEGRGTYTPFQLYGHPQMKGMPFTFTPKAIKGMSLKPKCNGQKCYGEDLRNEYKHILSKKGLELKWLIRAYKSYTGKKAFFNSLFNKIAGNDLLKQKIISGQQADDIRKSWAKDIEKFKRIRAKYLIYK